MSGGWDGEDRFKIVYEILGITGNQEKTLVKKWFIQCVGMIFNDIQNPFGAEGVLILSGKEGIGKTSFFRLMTPEPSWFKSQSQALVVENKDIMIDVLRCWIVELGEIDTTFKRQNGQLKSFVTQTYDRIRKPYSREPEEIVRITSFCGTTNKSEYLTNESGFRRWWNVNVDSIDLDRLNRFHDSDDLKQFWLQCVHLFMKDKTSFRLNQHEYEMLKEDFKQIKEVSSCETVLLNVLNFESDVNGWEWKTVSTLLARIPELSSFSIKEINKTLTSMIDFDYGIKKKHTKRGNEYLLPHLVEHRNY